MSTPVIFGRNTRGALLVLVLVMGSVFFILVSALIGTVINESQVVDVRIEQQKATEIAEAGLNYYKWYLSHFPGDTSVDGTTYVYEDPETGPIGEYVLDIDSTSYCGAIASIGVEVTGHTYVNPDAQAVVGASYRRPTVAEYSFITNSGVWWAGGNISGPVHSNQGLRMEAAHNSSVGSGQATWYCDGSYDCDPDVPNAPGVYSTGGNSTPGLFEFPVSPIDFAGLTLDLNDMKTRAINNDGIHYGPTTEWGYLVEFNGDSTIDVSLVTGTQRYWSYNATTGWTRDERNVITSTTLIADNQPIDADCPLIYMEDKTWIQGEVNQKLSIAAADLSQSAQTNIVVNGDITYTSGSDAGLLAIAEDDFDIGLEINDGSSEDLILNGILIAQNGRWGRDGYVTFAWPRLPSNLTSYAYLGSLTTLGTQVSNARAVTNWTGWSGFTGSGGGSSFDRDQVDNPPPLTPETNDVYELQDWRQEG